MLNDAKVANSDPLALTPEQVAQTLGVSRSTVYKLIRTSGFPAVRLGRKTIIPRAQLVEWLSQQAKAQSESGTSLFDTSPK